jgi:hypothetical protein
VRARPDLGQLGRPAAEPRDDVAASVPLDLEPGLLEPGHREVDRLVLLGGPADPVRADAVADLENVVQPPL